MEEWGENAAHTFLFMAIPASMMASDEPTVAVPTGWSGSGACQSRASMCTQRFSNSLHSGYWSLSITFLREASCNAIIVRVCLCLLVCTGEASRGVVSVEGGLYLCVRVAVLVLVDHVLARGQLRCV